MGGLGVFSTVQEMSTDLSIALSHALRVLSWQENLTSDEMPPSWMWPLEWELEIFFEELNREREAKYGGGNDSDEGESDLMSNDLVDEQFFR